MRKSFDFQSYFNVDFLYWIFYHLLDLNWFSSLYNIKLVNIMVSIINWLKILFFCQEWMKIKDKNNNKLIFLIGSFIIYWTWTYLVRFTMLTAHILFWTLNRVFQVVLASSWNFPEPLTFELKIRKMEFWTYLACFTMTSKP